MGIIVHPEKLEDTFIRAAKTFHRATVSIKEKTVPSLVDAENPEELMRIEATLFYRAKDGTEEKVFDALEWLAAMCFHIPDRGEQMVRYYGYYSNVSRGKRKETEDDGYILFTNTINKVLLQKKEGRS